MESGESETDTLKREVSEETGIDWLSIVDGFRKSIFYRYVPKSEEKESKKGISLIVKRVVYYICETGGGNVVLSDEHRDYEWLVFEKAVDRITHINGKSILTKAGLFLG